MHDGVAGLLIHPYTVILHVHYHVSVLHRSGDAYGQEPLRRHGVLDGILYHGLQEEGGHQHFLDVLSVLPQIDLHL